MGNPTLDDTCSRVDVLETIISREAMTCHSMDDPLEAVLISYEVNGT